MYAHERSLVNRLQDKPFVLLGVNSDDDREELKKVMQKEKITWRSWWDGGGMNGPIASKWRIAGWPTIYVLDDKGVIRSKNLPGKGMDRSVEALLKVMEAQR